MTGAPMPVPKSFEFPFEVFVMSLLPGQLRRSQFQDAQFERVPLIVETRKRLVRWHRGSVAVETAVLLPFLMLFAMGMGDFGRFSYAQISVASAAKNGAQYGSGSATLAQNTAGIASAAKAEMTTVCGYTSSNPSVDSTRIDEGSGDYSVKVTVSFQFTTAIKYPGLPQSLTLIRTAHMRVMP